MNLRWAARGGVVTAIALALGACEENPERVDRSRLEGALGRQARSPNADILPTPLSSAQPGLGSAGNPGETPIGPSPLTSARGESRLPDESPRPLEPHRALTDEEPRGKEGSVFALEAVWRWPDPDLGPLGGEVDVAQIERLRKLVAGKLSIDLVAYGRMRLAMGSRSFPLSELTELRARYDSYGHVLVWPDQTKYRMLPAGTLRAVLAEGRADLSAPITITARERIPGTRLGHPTLATTLEGPYGTLILEQARVDDAGRGGLLLCRTLLEIAGNAPSHPECQEGLIPVFAEYRWTGGGNNWFEVQELTRKPETTGRRILVPPPGAELTVEGLPVAGGAILAETQQQALRSKARIPDPSNPPAEGRGLLASNDTPEIAYLVLDRVRVAKLLPFRSVELTHLKPGSYRAAWHSFFGRPGGAAETVIVPGRLEVVRDPKVSF